MSERVRAPFLVAPSFMYHGKWILVMRKPLRGIGFFDTQGEAIDHAYRNWPWWM
jgi:hypothetical protein